ncbi:hypothetical protein EDD85DRAFT_961569 [Armillaria nabsnona]|nr:hypothetical protein EDD85DRAFT_961569 [Armillaria nabsnona]
MTDPSARVTPQKLSPRLCIGSSIGAQLLQERKLTLPSSPLYIGGISDLIPSRKSKEELTLAHISSSAAFDFTDAVFLVTGNTLTLLHQLHVGGNFPLSETALIYRANSDLKNQAFLELGELYHLYLIRSVRVLDVDNGNMFRFMFWTLRWGGEFGIEFGRAAEQSVIVDTRKIFHIPDFTGSKPRGERTLGLLIDLTAVSRSLDRRRKVHSLHVPPSSKHVNCAGVERIFVPRRRIVVPRGGLCAGIGSILIPKFRRLKPCGAVVKTMIHRPFTDEDTAIFARRRCIFIRRARFCDYIFDASFSEIQTLRSHHWARRSEATRNEKRHFEGTKMTGRKRRGVKSGGIDVSKAEESLIQKRLAENANATSIRVRESGNLTFR